MKKFVKFLFAGIVFIKTNFAMEASPPIETENAEQPLVQTPTPQSCSPLPELEAGLLASDIIIEGNVKIKTEPLSKIESSKTFDMVARMERTARFYKDTIFSRGPDCFDLLAMGKTSRLIYKDTTSPSHFSDSLLNGFTDFEPNDDLVYFLTLLRKMVARNESHLAMVEAVLTKVVRPKGL